MLMTMVMSPEGNQMLQMIFLSLQLVSLAQKILLDLDLVTRHITNSPTPNMNSKVLSLVKSPTNV